MEHDAEDARVTLAKIRTGLASERNRLATQRTFLAWLRTGLAAAGGGIAIIRLLSFEKFAHQVIAEISGYALVVLGISIFGLSFIDYMNNTKHLPHKKNYAGSVVFGAILALVLGGVCLALLLIAII